MTPGTFRTLTISALLLAGFGLLLLALDEADFFSRYQGGDRGAGAPQQRARAPEVRPVVIDRAADGHFWVNGYVAGDRVRFLVDTGASLVILNPADARRLGFDLWDEEYSTTVQTPGGQLRAAPVVLPEIEIGDRIIIYQVRAAVLAEGDGPSLLGQSFLRHLSGIRIDGDRMILSQ